MTEKRLNNNDKVRYLIKSTDKVGVKFNNLIKLQKKLYMIKYR